MPLVGKLALAWHQALGGGVLHLQQSQRVEIVSNGLDCQSLLLFRNLRDVEVTILHLETKLSGSLEDSVYRIDSLGIAVVRGVVQHKLATSRMRRQLSARTACVVKLILFELSDDCRVGGVLGTVELRRQYEVSAMVRRFLNFFHDLAVAQSDARQLFVALRFIQRDIGNRVARECADMSIHGVHDHASLPIERVCAFSFASQAQKYVLALRHRDVAKAKHSWRFKLFSAPRSSVNYFSRTHKKETIKELVVEHPGG
mmetsp:Transcript_47053/g.131181  ORF Transcript_47053/g.131181 Transcript_47053/m.131181 type:complete len:257 (+) Transcript_47053:3125-3895(+)